MPNYKVELPNRKLSFFYEATNHDIISRMTDLAANGISFPTLIAYGFLIFTYLIILRVLLNLLEQMSDKYRVHKSVIDRAIHQTVPSDLDSSMQAFNIYSIARVIVRWGIVAIAMAAIIVLLVIKVGYVATALLIAITVILLWAMNHWLKSREKTHSAQAEIRKYIEKSGNVGTIIVLSITLVVLLFLMIMIR